MQAENIMVTPWQECVRERSVYRKRNTSGDRIAITPFRSFREEIKNESYRSSNKYVQKTNAKMNDIVQDCLDIRKAAEDILAAYLEYSKQQIRSLGLDPHEIMPGVF